MFSNTVEYALRAMVYLAFDSSDHSSTDQIAQTTLVPRAYLSKVLQALRRAELVESRRGIGGGISLARAPEQITILDVVNAVEPIRRMTTCPLGEAVNGQRFCPLHDKVNMAIGMVEADFASTTLAEIVRVGDGESMPHCYPPAAPPAAPPANSPANSPADPPADPNLLPPA
jgi:Rrf2 family protein